MKNLIKVALGQEPADLVVKNGQIVNVASGEIYPGGVAVAGDKIAAIGDVDYTIGPNTQVVDAQGAFITPGFVEGHIHPESSNLSLPRFAEVVLAHGTTSVFSDLHEIGVVGGLPAIEASLKEVRRTLLKLYFVIPSHVPFSPGLETSGGHIDSTVIAENIQREDVVGLSEIVSLYVIFGHPDLLRSIDLTSHQRKILAGHGPETHGPAWSAFVATGIFNDHEALSVEEVLLRVRNGVHAQLRHNLIVPTLPELLKALTEKHVDSRFLSLVTDDTSAVALTENGHLDYLVRLALSQGVDYVKAIQMVTINAAASFRKEDEIGLLAPGRYADINITSGPEDFKVLLTIANGKVVAKENRLIEPLPDISHDPLLLNTFHLKGKIESQDLLIPAPQGASKVKVHFMKTLPWIPITEGGEAVLQVECDFIACDPSQDILHIAVIERHQATGNIGKAFIGGFGLKRGAMASSIAHDNHNIVVMGVNPQDMAVAANRVAELGGGIVLAEGGKVVDEIPLPIVGLLSDLDAWSFAQRRKEILAKAREMGCQVHEPFMFLSFITLAALPAFAITDKGYVDVSKQQFLDPVLGVAE